MRAPSFFACVAAGLLAAQAALGQALDTVLLTNGGRVRGQVMEDTAQVVSVLLPDGTTRKIPRAEVARVDYAGTAPPATTPAAPDGPPCSRDADCAADRFCDARDRCVPRAPLAPPPGAPPYVGPGTFAPSGDGRTETVGIKGLWLTGLIVFGSVYVAGIPAAAGISAAAGSKEPGSHAGMMAIPFAGPWLEAAGVVEEESSEGTPGFVAVGALQIVGATLFIIGVSVRRERRMTATSLVDHAPLPRPFITYGPLGRPSGGGLAIGGAL